MNPIHKPNSYLLQTRYHETYAIANIVNNVLADPFPYCRNLNDFYGDNQSVGFATPFPKFSAFHQFIEFVLRDYINEDVSAFDLDSSRKNFDLVKRFQKDNKFLLPINHGLSCHGLEHDSFEVWLQEHGKDLDSAQDDDVSDYYEDLYLTEAFDQYIFQTAQEVFFIMFLNRQTLLDFNELIARNAIEPLLLDEVDSEYKKYFSGSGRLRRVKIPRWVKNAVFHRDRGHCVFCNKDVSGTLSLQNENNFDHMVPLSHGGINDVTNIQLLCDKCNLAKSDGEARTSATCERWYK